MKKLGRKNNSFRMATLTKSGLSLTYIGFPGSLNAKQMSS